MATSREHFALDWIKGELLETLNTARTGLESFAEALDNGEAVSAAIAGDDLRACVNALHQVHGTLVMLELKGVTLLADHLERVAEALRDGELKDVNGASQSLMQGILELPGHLDQLQGGAADSQAALLPLANELRTHLGEAPLATAGVRLYGIAGADAVRRFGAIDGQGKTRKIRGVYQQVLLTLLKGGDLGRAIETLRKVAQSMIRVCEGTPFQGQWQAFAEFIEGLAAGSTDAPLDGEAVKLLRRADSEIRELAQRGAAALERQVPLNLVRQLLDAARSRGRTSELVGALEAALAQGDPADTMSLSGRQAMVSAATALREELGAVKDRLDLFVRGDRSNAGSLSDLQAPLKQIASTLSLVGFESSRSIVLDQVELLASLAESGSADEGSILTIAGSLVQVDENLASLTQSGKGEVEQITDDAQRAVARQTRQGLDQIKQSIVDYVSSQWDARHLRDVPAQLDSIIGALGMIPLAYAAELIRRCRGYISAELMAGHVPSWEELDRLADALSGIDYYLERLASDSPGGAEDVLELVHRSLEGLSSGSVAETSAPTVPEPAPAELPVVDARVVEDPAGADVDGEDADAAPPDNVEPPFGAAEDVDVAAVGGEDEVEEPKLALEADEDFDLSSELFDDISGEVNQGERAAAPSPEASADAAADAAVAHQAGTEPDAATAAPESTTAATLPAGLADQFESDDEIVEIFSEEVDEVLETIDDQLGGWAQALEDEAHQTEVRRAFHTLKGSGRMVGANVLGEMAWSVENMLNRVLDGTVAVSADFPVVVEQARLLTPALRDAFVARTGGDLVEVGRIMEQADLLASGGSLADTADRPEAAGADVADDDRELFLQEAEGHVAVLAAARRDDGSFVLDDEAMRALHTLAGSSALAGLTAVGELATPAYELAQALRGSGRATGLTDDGAEFFAQVTAAMSAALADLRTGREPEDHFQLVAEADRLLVSGQAPARPETLMSLPALNSIMKATDLLDAWREGAVDLALADEVQEALREIAGVATAEQQPTVANLAGALARTHERFEFESLNQDAYAVFSRAHDELLGQFDALAAHQTPMDAAATGLALDALQPATARDEVEDEWEDDAAPAEPGDVLGAEVEAAAAGLGDRPEASNVPESSDVVPEPMDTTSEPEAAAPEPQAAAPESAAAPPERAPADPTPREQPVVARMGDHAPAGGAVDEARTVLPEDVDPDIIEVFFEEADELLEALDQGINDWTDAPDNRLHLENLLRALHTLKGGARLSGLTRLGDETHDFESFLIEFQESDRQAEPALFDALHGRYDALAVLVAGVRASLSGAAPDTPATPVEVPHVPEPAATEPEAEASVADSDAEEPAPAPPATARVESNVASLRRASEAAHAARAAAAEHPAKAEQGGETRQEPAAAQAQGAQEMVRVGAGLLESLVNLAGESSIIRARVEQGMSDFTGALDEMEITIERLREQLRRLEIETETQVLFRQERADGPSYEDFDPLEMDRYSQLQQLSRSLGESASDMLDLKETLLFKAREAETLLLQQARVNTELQEGLMRSRMVPFSRLVPRLKRTVRQVAKELGKDVELYAFNIEGELDRSLLERMVPPLEHMLRNAVDHGIEKPERRRSVGKAQGGRIDLRLAREGGDVVIEISDDGAGIDVEKVRAKAVERGLMARDADLRDDEISQFVLAPGFSTAASITQISGRGVGMDVVHSEVKQLGGSISIHSEPGRGTRFVLRVPFTVSVNRALMVSVGDDLYAIPLNTIEGIVLLSPDELDALYAPDGHTFEYAGVPYRIQYLGSFLGREYHAQPMRGSVPVVLVRSGEHAVAVHVDAVQGSREIVVKSLGPQFAGVGGISGATILGDGSVVVILDLLALIRSRANASGPITGKRTLTGAARTRCVMVVDDSVTVRKVTSRLLERQGMNVVVAKDGVEAVSLLQEQRPDVMLLDIEMPRMDGFEVLRQVRHDERLKDLPIVMISSRTGTKHQDRAADLGVSRFLGKPFQESELLATIDELVK